MGHLLQSVSEKVRTEELKTQLRNVVTAFLSHREVSTQGAVCVLSFSLQKLSRSVVFLDTHKKMSLEKNSLCDLDDDDTDVFKKSLIERYEQATMLKVNVCCQLCH